MRLQRAVMMGAAVLMLTTAAAPQGKGSSPEARLRAAIDTETVDGDLTAAADGYKQIISDRSANRAVVAQALLRLGMAYEKQGSQEANTSYERLVHEFGDQPAIAQVAKTRLAAAAASVGPTLRQVCSSGCDFGDRVPGARISPDGRLLLVQRNGGLAVREMGSTGSFRQIVPESTTGVIFSGEFSPDGRRIFYTVRPPQPGRRGQLIVVDADGRNARTLHSDAVGEEWSTDGRRILATSGNRLFWVTVADGAVQPIPISAWENIDVFSISPDGHYIAFSGNRNDATPENVFVIGTDGSGEVQISPKPIYQEPVGWSRDGKYLLYGQFGETTTLWGVPFANGRAQGPPLSLRQITGRNVSFLGITRSGTLLYRTLSGGGEAYTVSMDPASGKVTSVPAVLPTPTGAGPAKWSPDSERVAYLTTIATQRELHVFSPKDGKDQRVPARESLANSLCWPRGGEAVLTNTSADAKGQPVRVDLATGETRPLFPGAAFFRLWNCTATTAASSAIGAVKVRNIATGAETELYRIKRPTSNYGMSKISPDGRFVAFNESIDSDTSALLVVPSSGGTARELTRAAAPAQIQSVDGHEWSHDSRYLYFFRRANSSAPHQLYRVPVDGGKEEYMGLQGMDLRGLEISPDGRKAFLIIGAFGQPEVWALENFLPSGR